jgi:hypothetical protein
MALGEQSWEAFVVASDIPKPPGHLVYTAQNRLLAENGFDPLVEKLCAPTTPRSWAAPECPRVWCLPPRRNRLAAS